MSVSTPSIRIGRDRGREPVTEFPRKERTVNPFSQLGVSVDRIAKGPEQRTILEFLSPTLPDLFGRIPFTNNGVFLAIQASNSPEGSWSILELWAMTRENRWGSGRNLRWLGLVAFLLAPSTSDTTRLGTTLGDLQLTSGHGQGMFARATPFPWNMHGSTRRRRRLRLRMLSQRGFTWLNIVNMNVIIRLVEFLDFGGHVHGEVRVAVVMLLMSGDQTKGERVCRGSSRRSRRRSGGGGALDDGSRLRLLLLSRVLLENLAIEFSGRRRTIKRPFTIPRTRRRKVIRGRADAGAVGGERIVGEIRLGGGGVAPVMIVRGRRMRRDK